MQKVAIIAPNSLPVPPIRGGAVQSSIFETTRLYKRFKPYIFSICEPNVDDLPLAETIGNAEYRRIKLTDREEFFIRLRHFTNKNYFPYVNEIIKQIKEIKPDLINIVNRPWFLPILRKHLGKSAKIILNNHNAYFREMREGHVKKLVSKMDGFIGVSQACVNVEITDRFPELKDKCNVVYNAADLKRFDPDSISQEKRSRLKTKLNISADELVITFIGRLREDKGAAAVLSAISDIIKSGTTAKIKLLVIGSHYLSAKDGKGALEKNIRELAEGIKDHVVFTGYVNFNEIQDYYAISDIITAPSIIFDSSPFVCYESQAMKVPMVSSFSGGIPEIIEDGKTGLLVRDPRNVADMASKLRFFIENKEERVRFGERGRERIIKHFTWEKAAEDTENAYERILSNA
jgi:spore coat protein SA